ncbi:hypothetical protein AB6A40_005519 [Gnathostoma spinigerum]|uniref:Transmembrane protein n=1 Tax=Gnathostoma spinigerum TaxID=75299 RepID=A0ABD6ERB9_9BILA
MVTYTVEEDQLLNSWYLQVPIFLILIEIIVLCVVRCILAYLKIAKYADERRECTAEPNLDTSYFVEPSNSSVSDQKHSPWSRPIIPRVEVPRLLP